MADNIAITAGSGTSMAADDISSVFYPRAKLSLGADGTAVDAVAGAGVVGTGVQRITLASDDPLVALVGADYAYTSTVSFTTGTTAYAAQDAVGVGAGSAVHTLTSIGPTAGRVFITRVSLLINLTALISGQTSYVLHFYDATPGSALNDSTAWDLASGDQANYLGNIPIPTPTDYGSTLWADVDCLKQLKLAAASTSLYCYLVSVGAYTPTAVAHKLIVQAVNAS